MKRAVTILLLSIAPSVFAAVKGVVYDDAGNPVAGARLVARRSESTSSLRSRVMAGGERETLARVTSAEDGTFSIEPGVGGVVDLLAEHDGFAPESHLVLNGESDVLIAIARARTRTGHVTGAGKPVAGALVLAMNDSTVIWSVRTDATGKFSIADPAAWCSGLVVAHPDFAPAFANDPNRTGISLQLMLTPGRTVSGVVNGPDGPMPNARVTAGPWTEGITDDKGAFDLPHVDQAIRIVTASSGKLAGNAPVTDKNLVISLKSTRTISGTVRDPEKRPFAGAIVSTFGESWDHVEKVLTDDTGSYEVSLLDAGDYSVNPEAIDEMSFPFESASLKKITSARLDFLATRARLLRGIVTDESNRPIPGASLMWIRPGSPVIYAFTTKRFSGETKSGPDGRFRIAMLAGGHHTPVESARLQAIKPQFAVGVTEPISFTANPQTVSVVLRKGIIVNGRVTDDEGRPVENVGIAVIEEPWGAQPMPIESAIATPFMHPFVLSGPTGEFTLHLNAKLHDIGAWKEGFAGARVGGITPKEGDAPLALKLIQGVEIRGRVTRKGSTKPMEGTAMVEGEDGAFARANVARDGSFVMASLRPGAYTLAFEGSTVTKRIKAPASGVELELPAVGEIRGRVIDKATRQGIADSYVSSEVTGSEMDVSMAMADPEGSFTLEVPPGSIKLEAKAEGYVAASRAVDVEVGKTQAVTLELTAGRTVTGHVADEIGTPIANATVDSENNGVSAVETDEAGEFVISGLSHEALTLKAQATGYVGRTFIIEEGTGDAQKDVSLSRGRKAKGKVLSSGGEPVEGATIRTYDDDTQQAVSGADGTFVIQGLTSDRLTFHASKTDLGSAEVEDADITGEIVITFKSPTGWGSVHGRVDGFAEGDWTYGAVMASEGTARTPIGRDGTYRLERVPAGKVELAASAMSRQGDVRAQPVKVDVPAGGDVEVNLAFRSDIALSGLLIENGRAAPGRRVRFTSGERSSSATTDEHGHYRLSAIEPGMYEVSVDIGQRSFSTRFQVVQSTSFDIRIDSSEIRGAVTDDAGTPLPGVTIEISGADGPSSKVATATTDPNGAFSLNVFRGTYIVTATLKRFATAVQRVEAGSPPMAIRMTSTDGLLVRLVDARDGRTLDGFVVATDAGGLNLVRLHESQKDGSILVPLASGTYRISASASRYATQSIRATLPRKEELRIALTPGGNLVIELDRPSSDLVKLVLPNGDEYVRCECNGIAEIRLTGMSTTIEHVAPGSYTLKVLDERGRVKTSYPVVIAEGQTTTTSIHVPE